MAIPLSAKQNARPAAAERRASHLCGTGRRLAAYQQTTNISLAHLYFTTVVKRVAGQPAAARKNSADQQQAANTQAMVKLSRAQIRPGVKGVDVTVKSAQGFAPSFAPTWKMVKGYMHGTS